MTANNYRCPRCNRGLLIIGDKYICHHCKNKFQICPNCNRLVESSFLLCGCKPSPFVSTAGGRKYITVPIYGSKEWRTIHESEDLLKTKKCQVHEIPIQDCEISSDIKDVCPRCFSPAIKSPQELRGMRECLNCLYRW